MKLAKLIAEYKTLGLRQKTERLRLTKRILKVKKSVWSNLRYAHPDWNNGGKTQATCSACGASAERTQAYYFRYECSCQRGTRVSEALQARFDLTPLYAAMKKARIVFVEQYTTMNTATLVRCLRCAKEFKTYPGNLRKGHGCRCGAREKQRKTNLSKYGVESALLHPKVRRKMRKTMVARYGTEHALQNQKLFAKNLHTAYALKPYQLGDREVMVQGYESAALDYLTAKGIKPTSIICSAEGGVPSVPYVFDGKRSIYHPDIFLPKQNMVVEVKSDYTLKADRERNLAKRQACLDSGYKFKFLVFDREGNKVNVRVH